MGFWMYPAAIGCVNSCTLPALVCDTAICPSLRTTIQRRRGADRSIRSCIPSVLAKARAASADMWSRLCFANHCGAKSRLTSAMRTWYLAATTSLCVIYSRGCINGWSTARLSLACRPELVPQRLAAGVLDISLIERAAAMSRRPPQACVERGAAYDSHWQRQEEYDRSPDRVGNQ